MFSQRLLIDISELKIKTDKQLEKFNAIYSAKTLSLKVHYKMKRPELPSKHTIAVSTDKSHIITLEGAGRQLGIFEVK